MVRGRVGVGVTMFFSDAPFADGAGDDSAVLDSKTSPGSGGGIYKLHPTQSGESRLLGCTHSYIHPVALTWPPMKSEVVRRRCPTVFLHSLPSLDFPLLSFPLV